jgi:hypothetical protein
MSRELYWHRLISHDVQRWGRIISAMLLSRARQKEFDDGVYIIRDSYFMTGTFCLTRLWHLK